MAAGSVPVRDGVPVAGARPWVMGIVNVTPDSFSDGGRWSDTGAAVQRGRDLVGAAPTVVLVDGEHEDVHEAPPW